MHTSDRNAQIKRFLQRVKSDASLAEQVRSDPAGALRTAGFDSSLAGFLPDVVAYAGVPSCVDPPETNHYANN
jgi:hypothetical protein